VVHVFGLPYAVSHVYAFSAGGATNWDIIQGNMQRRRLMMPPHVLAQLAWEVLTTPPPDEEIYLLTEVVEEAQEQNLSRQRSRHVCARYRIWHWLKVIAKNDVRIATNLMLLLMIIDTLLRLCPSCRQRLMTPLKPGRLRLIRQEQHILGLLSRRRRLAVLASPTWTWHRSRLRCRHLPGDRVSRRAVSGADPP
jgi:hypothetical protein